MTTPSYVVQMNVNLYSDKLSNVVDLGTTTDGGRQVLLWDNLSASDREIVDAFIKAHPPAPIVAATSGSVTIAYNSPISGDTAIVMYDPAPAPATFMVDGRPITFNIDPSTITIFTSLVNVVTAGVQSDATVTVNSNGMTITSNSTGAASTVVVDDNTKTALVINGMPATYTVTAGTDAQTAGSLWQTYQVTRSPNGALYSEAIPAHTVLPYHPGPIAFAKEVPYSYYDGTLKKWLYKADLTPICS